MSGVTRKFCIMSGSIILLFLILAMIIQLHEVSAQSLDNISFQNQFSFTDETKIMHVFGEVRNESNVALRNVLVTGSFFDDNSLYLGEYQREAELQVLNPGQSSPFEIEYLDPKSVARVNNYTLAATGLPSEEKENRLTVSASNSRLDLFGTYYINGLIKNEGKDTAVNSIAIAALYNSDGKLIAIGKAMAEAQNFTSNIPPMGQGPFTIVVTEKVQTYKAKKIVLQADSDQYTSEQIVLNSGNAGNPQSPAGSGGGCLIATAAFGSDLAPQVQLLRGFRDGIVLKTAAGTSFMNVFNAWYYSFSPLVAQYERDQTWLREIVKTLVYPLLAILQSSSWVYEQVSFNSELGVVAAGLVASPLIALVYFVPVAVIATIASHAFPRQATRHRGNILRTSRILLIFWSMAILLVVVGELLFMVKGTTTDEARFMLMAGTSLIVLCSVCTVIYLAVRLTHYTIGHCKIGLNPNAARSA